MNVLVDYDNVSKLERNRGIVNLIDKILNTIGVSVLSKYQRISVKLYGGWYEGNSLSRSAQNLVAEIGVFPKAFIISDGSHNSSVIVKVTLAYSLEIDPRNNLENTYRRSNVPEGLRCSPPPYLSCINDKSCPIGGLHNFIETGNCDISNCRVTTAQILSRDEQKLVDTMIVADLIYLARDNSLDLCVVSSDDDLWVGIKTALLLGNNVFHIQTKNGRATPGYYKRGAGSKYTELFLR
jgi:hypothetical protein